VHKIETTERDIKRRESDREREREGDRERGERTLPDKCGNFTLLRR